MNACNAGRGSAWLDFAVGSADAEAKAARGYAQRGRGTARPQHQRHEQQPAGPRQADRAPAALREPKQPSPDAQQPDDEEGFVYPNRVRLTGAVCAESLMFGLALDPLSRLLLPRIANYIRPARAEMHGRRTALTPKLDHPGSSRSITSEPLWCRYK